MRIAVFFLLFVMLAAGDTDTRFRTTFSYCSMGNETGCNVSSTTTGCNHPAFIQCTQTIGPTSWTTQSEECEVVTEYLGWFVDCGIWTGCCDRIHSLHDFMDGRYGECGGFHDVFAPCTSSSTSTGYEIPGAVFLIVLGAVVVALSTP
jgi:hypothetical protein